VIADATRAHAAKAPNLQALRCRPRLPHTLGVVSQVIMPALTGESGHWLDAPTRAQGVEWCPDGSAQRWWVVCSQAALARAAATVTTARPRAYEALETPCVPLQAQRFATPAAAHQALAVLAKAGP
jgi:hypothetical protein